jgi:acetate kinase
MMAAPVLVVNAGSTSVKLSVVGDAAPDDVAWSYTTEPTEAALRLVLEEERDALSGVECVGHRIVHGGTRFVDPVVVDDEVVAAIEGFADLAPLHNELGLTGIRAARAAFPDVPHVACFDTAFHASMPDAARAYGAPYEWFDAGRRRYGFHGLSHQHAVARAAAMLDRTPSTVRFVTCHLGGGCSLAAVAQGRSVDTTMGFTPLDGLVMSTRSGAIDPGLLLHVLRTGGTVDEIDELLEHRSGLLGLSGLSGDLRDVIAARDGGDGRARLAIDVFVHRLITGIGAMIGALGATGAGGVDALVFTGGIGERSSEIRARAAAAFAWLGAEVDDAVNDHAAGDFDVSTPNATVRVIVVKAREDLVIASAARELVGPATASSGGGSR